MNILIVGNICSGKTSIAKELNRIGCVNSVVSIDELRREHSDGTFAGEFKAWHLFLKELQEADGNSMFEFSGTGKNSWFVREIMKKSNWVTIFCSCDRSILRQRIKNRENDVPFPYDLEIEDSIDYIGKELQKKFMDWYYGGSSFALKTNTTLSDSIRELRNKLGYYMPANFNF